jgi:hypothetical protein
MKNKKTILSLSLLLALYSCDKESPIPNIQCRVVEQGSNVPIPFAQVQWYELEGFGSTISYVPSFISIANETGEFEMPKDATVDIAKAVANSSDQYSEFGFTDVSFNAGSPSLSIPVSCKASLRIQLIDDLNTQQNLVGASFEVSNGFRGMVQEADLAGHGAECIFDVSAHFPIELEIKKHYPSGNYSSEWITLDPIEANEINTYTLYY